MNEVEQFFKDKSILIANTPVYSKPVALDFINMCNDKNIPILGIDAFIVKQNFHQPSMANSIDFTSKYRETVLDDLSWDIATTFLHGVSDEYYFEIIT